MVTYRLESDDILSTVIRSPDPHDVVYSIHTTFNSSGRQDTFVSPTENNVYGAPRGIIHWQTCMFEIGPETAQVQNIRACPSEEWAQAGCGREWCWSKRKYRLRWYQEQWVAASETSGGFSLIPTAVFTPAHSSPSVAGKARGSFQFMQEVSAGDMIFLIMAFIFSELECFDMTEETPGLA